MEQCAYDFIRQSEKNHWWFVGRRILIGKILQMMAKSPFIDSLDIGSGYGAMIPLLLKYSLNVDCIEPWEESRFFLQQFGARTIYDIKDFPQEIPDKQYNFVSLFDVLEHIKDQEEALDIIFKKVLKQDGKIMITVPAYQWMWSKHDEIHHHCRRYTKKELICLLKEKGYRNIRATYFMTFLFPIAVFQRLCLKRSSRENEFQSLPFLINWFLKIIFLCESWFIRYFPYPYGLSVVAIAEK